MDPLVSVCNNLHSTYDIILPINTATMPDITSNSLMPTPTTGECHSYCNTTMCGCMCRVLFIVSRVDTTVIPGTVIPTGKVMHANISWHLEVVVQLALFVFLYGQDEWFQNDIYT